MPRPIARSGVLLEEAGFRYAIATAEWRSEIVRVLSESFSREPMGVTLRVSASELAPLVERFMPECTSNGLSVLATPVDEPGDGGRRLHLSGLQVPAARGSPRGVPMEFLPVGQALMTVGEAYEATRPPLEIGEAVDLWMVGVAEARFARRGIAGALFRICSELPRQSGYTRCVTECTGRYSQKAAEPAGFTEVARLAYQDFRFEGRPVFAAIGPPHTHLALYERAL